MPIIEFLMFQVQHHLQLFFQVGNHREGARLSQISRVLWEERSPCRHHPGRSQEGESDDGMPPSTSRGGKSHGMWRRGRQDRRGRPQQAARSCALSEATGLRMGSGMEEALSRMERGEDPDSIEQEMGSLLEEEEPFIFEQKSRPVARSQRPAVDETLYDL